MNSYVEHKIIKGKDIYIFESHQYSLFPWANLRNNLTEAPVLISLDHHTDTHEPFLHACAPGPRYEYNKQKASNLVKEINFSQINSIEKAVLNLKNDEHIKTAIESNIISKAFIISYNNLFDFPQSYEEKRRIDNFQQIMMNNIMGIDSPEENIKRPYTYEESDIYMPPISSERLELSSRESLEYAIETEFLEEKFEIFNHMCSDKIGSDYRINDKYILDIDLDYFHTIKSIQPSNADFFYKLIKNAEIITIALESVCVELLKEEYEIKEDINSTFLLDQLLKHIKQAL